MSARLMWGGVVAAMLIALPAAAQERAGGQVDGALTATELEALDRALTGAGLTREDLKYGKRVYPANAVLPAVQRALDDPLAGHAAAWSASRITSPTASSVARLAETGGGAAAQEAPATFPDEMRETQMTRLRIASPFLPEATRRRVKRLPEPVLAMIGELSALLAQPPENGVRSVPSQIAHGLRGVRAHERILIRSWGLRHVLAPDEAFAGFQPVTLHPVEGTLAAQSGFGDPTVSVLHVLSRVDRAALAAAADRLTHFATQVGRVPPGLGVTKTIDDPAGLVSGGILARVPTRFGDIVIGGAGNNRYMHGSAQFIIDLGGDDTYAGGLGGVDGTPGRPVALLVDVNGNDTYEAETACSFGGALLGVAVCVDLMGDDTYLGTLVSQGAAVAGCGVLFDAGGADHYRAERHAQGAALGGVGLLRDDGEANDEYRVVTFGQGFGRTAGTGLLHDAGGDDTYLGGGEYPYLPQAPQHTYSHCQGYGIGVREQGFAGGVGMLVDRAGNDTYRASMHSQGGATWYAMGVLADLEGNDTYEAVFNSQGAAVHIAAGMLLDGGGDDLYRLASDHDHEGMGQGSAHDFAVGLLHDLGGNDRYEARAGAQGVGFTTALGMLVDRAGDDVYAGEAGHLQGAGRRNRQLPSLGILVDAGGNDEYSTGRVDGDVWAWSDLGVGCDLGPGAGRSPANRATAGGSGDKELDPVKLPPPAPEARLSPTAFAALWHRASIWSVGEARPDTRRARDELIAWGPRCLHFIEREMGAAGTWWAPKLWAIDDVLGGIFEDHPAAVTHLLRNVTARENSQERTIGMMVGARLRVDAVAPAVLADLEKPGTGRFAVRAAGMLRLLQAVPAIKKLAASDDATKVATALRALGKFEEGVGRSELQAGLRHPVFLVRDTAQGALGTRPKRPGQGLYSGLVQYPDFFRDK